MTTPPAVRSIILGALALVFVAGCAPPPTPEQEVANDAARALGGRDQVLAVRHLALTGDGRQFNLGQDLTPGASGQTFNVSSYARRFDLESRRVRTELTRTPAFAYFQGPAAQRQVTGLDGEIGYTVNATGAATRVSEQAASDRRAEYFHHPLTAVRAMLQPGAAVTNARSAGDERLVDVAVDAIRFSIAIDAEGRPRRVESRSAHPNLGDVVNTTEFSEYQEAGPVELPMQIVSKVDDFVTSELRVTSAVDGDVGDLAAPSAASAASPPAPAVPNVVPQELARGVWLLAGQSHHSALIELSDSLLLVEAPQSEARTLAAIAKARELRPGKPLARLVMTHHHFDHTAGLRAAIAEGLTIVTHEGNRGFVEQMAARPHTIVPDTLARAPKPLVVETVGAERILKDAQRTVALYHVDGNPHSSTMLMVHLPAERLLIEVDAFSPGAQVNPYAANLLEQITRRKLRVDRIVPLHGAVARLADLEAAIK